MTSTDQSVQLRTLGVAVLPGDGIGREVTEAALAVLRAAECSFRSVQLRFEEFRAGAGEYRLRGNDLPEATRKACRNADAIFLGAMGLPGTRRPDGRELAPQIDLRESLELYCGVRPVRLFHSADCALKDYDAGEIDLVIVRESTEGLFWSRNSAGDGRDDEARDTMRISRIGSERLFRAAFRLARSRRRHVTLVDKANVLPSMVYFRRIFDEVAAEFPDVSTERIYVDAAALFLVQRPETFDVIVTENMFGDILSDLAAGLVGGMGMAPSADIGDARAVFQPAHGTAPDIAGRGIANPVAAILSAAMMLDWFNQDETRAGARRIQQAVEETLADPHRRTPDMGGQLTTSAMTDAILERLRCL
ncbi:MAG: isocitrate/isopropylmalate dehydrogenase family protein [Planctomycetaceae bacterium]